MNIIIYDSNTFRGTGIKEPQQEANNEARRLT
jgi:hypothetical protein